jgi:hypothetical protein
MTPPRVPPEEIERVYGYTKDLVMNGHMSEVKNFLHNSNFAIIWEPLLHHAMIQQNCPVTKRILIQLINSKILEPDEIQMRVSKIDHAVSLDFQKRVRDYLKSDEFEAAFENHSNVRMTAENQLKHRLGLPFLEPKHFSKDM